MVHEYKGKYKLKNIYTNLKNNNNIKLGLKGLKMIEKSEFYTIFFRGPEFLPDFQNDVYYS